MKIKIDKIVYGGKGIGKVNNKTCFVPYVLPEEEVDVEVVKEKTKLCEGVIKNIIKKSPLRIDPKCKYFTECGGCDFQHANYETQIKIKKDILEETLNRIGKIEKYVDKIVPSKNPFFYRNRVQFKSDGKNFGFFKSESKEIINIESCVISHEKINEAIKGFREICKLHKNIKEIHVYYPNTEKALIKIVLNEYEEINTKSITGNLPIDVNGIGIYLNSKRLKTFGKTFTFEKVEKFNFRVSIDSFFQVNRFQIENILNEVLQEVEENKVVGDIFCGVGLFTIPVSKKSKKVFGIELNKSAVKDANYNLKINNIKNAKFFQSSAEKSANIIFGYNPEILIFDPPRTGINKSLIEKILKLKKLKKIIYVSCNPSTAARDINLLNKNFELKKVKLIDMFPQTHHIESIFVLEKR